MRERASIRERIGNEHLRRLDLPFDQYQRYRIVQEVIDHLRWRTPLTVLDVGGSPATLVDFLPADRVVVADIADQGGLHVIANGLALPFGDGTFDVVTTCDTLEHIPPENRERFLAELVRVAREVVIVAAPFDNSEVVQAEEVLQSLIWARYGEGYNFLEEHRRYGLPDLQWTEGFLRDRGFGTVTLPNGYLDHWLLALSIFFLLQWRFHDAELSGRVNAYYNSRFYRSDNREPSYRKVIVASRTLDVSALRAEICREVAASDAERSRYLQVFALLVQALTESWSARAMALDQELKDREAAMRTLMGQLAEQSEWAKRSAQDVVEREATIRDLEGQLADQAAWGKRSAEEAEILRRKLGEVQQLLAQREGELQSLRKEVGLLRGRIHELDSRFAQREFDLGPLLHARDVLIPPGSRRDRLFWRAIAALDLWRAAGPAAVARRAVWLLQQEVLKWKRVPTSALPQAPEQSADAELPPIPDGVAAEVPAPPTPLPLSDARPSVYDVIVFPIIDWDYRFQRPQQIAACLARRGHRVFYVRTTFHNGSGPQVRLIRDNVLEVALPASRPVTIYSEHMDGGLRGALLQAFHTLAREYRIVNAVCFVDLPFWSPLAFALRDRYGWKVIFDCMDHYSGFSTVGARMLDEEPRLARHSDLVVATSRDLFERHSPLNPNSILVPNAADFEHFATAPATLAAEMQGLARPIIGYYGAIANWFDAELVGKLAELRPDWNFVLIGRTFMVDLAPLVGRRNVHLLGEKPYHELPGYLHGFDVCIIPFKKMQLTEATNPVKLFEYLSAGKPVVATDLSEIRQYSEHVLLPATSDEWLQALERALTEQDSARTRARIEFARANRWEDRVAVIQDRINALYPLASIIVVTFNNLEYTRQCLESIYDRTVYPNFEVIIVDNASTDGTREFLERFAREHERCTVIFNDGNVGFARANNQGLAIARGEYVVFLNNDVVVTRGWLSRLVFHLRDARVGMVGPVTNWSGNESRIQVDYESLAQMETFAERYTWDHFGETFDIHMLAFFCVAMRRAVLDEVGPLDERFEIGMFEDDDFSLRVRQRGYQIICAEDVFVHHWGRASFGQLPEGEYQALFERNRRKFEEKWGIKWEPHRGRPGLAG